MKDAMKRMTMGSLFSGVGGFDVGFRDAGFDIKWEVEIEPFCRAILRTRFPEAELLNDVTECGKHNLGAVDVLTAGFPCQDLSVAGKRAGLAGSRSGLFWEVVRILGELRPAWFVLENVPGLFSSNNGEDFRIVLESLDELGYGLAWRVLDSQFFGVAQRRRRVFIVGSFGKPCPAEVLFESEGGEGDSQACGEAWAGVAREVAGCLGSIGNGGFSANCEKAADGYLQTVPSLPSNGDQHKGFRNGEGLHVAAGFNLGASAGAGTTGYREGIAPTLRSGNGGNKAAAFRMQAFGEYSDDGSASALKQRDWKDATDLICSETSDTDRVRSFAGLPEGLDSARYRALGNAVTAKVANWIGRRIVACHEDKHALNK